MIFALGYYLVISSQSRLWTLKCKRDLKGAYRTNNLLQPPLSQGPQPSVRGPLSDPLAPPGASESNTASSQHQIKQPGNGAGGGGRRKEAAFLLPAAPPNPRGLSHSTIPHLQLSCVYGGSQEPLNERWAFPLSWGQAWEKTRLSSGCQQNHIAHCSAPSPGPSPTSLPKGNFQGPATERGLCHLPSGDLGGHRDKVPGQAGRRGRGWEAAPLPRRAQGPQRLGCLQAASQRAQPLRAAGPARSVFPGSWKVVIGEAGD